MSLETILFLLFAGTTLGSAVMVVTLRNPMYCAISLLVTFLCVAALFLLRHAEFLALVQVFVYGGGIMVLFLFVIMLVNLQNLREASLYFGQSRAAAVLVLAFAALFIFVVMGVDFAPAFAEPDNFEMVEGVVRGNTEAVAWSLYRDYLLPFEIASIFLLVAMLGAVILGRRN